MDERQTALVGIADHVVALLDEVEADLSDDGDARDWPKAERVLTAVEGLLAEAGIVAADADELHQLRHAVNDEPTDALTGRGLALLAEIGLVMWALWFDAPSERRLMMALGTLGAYRDVAAVARHRGDVD